MTLERYMQYYIELFSEKLDRNQTFYNYLISCGMNNLKYTQEKNFYGRKIYFYLI